MGNINSDLYAAHPRANIGETMVYDKAAVGTSDVGTNDTVTFVKIPAGATLLDLLISITDIDEATAAVFDVGISGDADKFITASTAGQGGGIARMNNSDGALYEFTADAAILLTFTTGAGTPAAGTIKLVACYSMTNAL